MVIERMFRWLLDLRAPLPRGMCTIELLGHVRIHGTVRRRWALIEVASQEPGEENEKTLHGPAAFYSIRQMSADEAASFFTYAEQQRQKEAEKHRAREEQERRRQADLALRDRRAPDFIHSSWSSGIPACGTPTIPGLRVVDDESYNCPWCMQAEDDIPF